jgi:hypothetical protein
MLALGQVGLIPVLGPFMRSHADYKTATALVGDIIRKWDPYCLLSEGAPSDEFEGEISRVVAHIPRITSAAAAAQVLSQVFSDSFEPELFTPGKCEVPASELFARLVASGLAPGA